MKNVVTFVRIFNAGFFKVSVEDDALLKKNPFRVMEAQLEKAVENGIRPVIILDEIQTLKDIYMNGERMLLDELFNFFVSITKETHLAHVILDSSDSFFISELHQNAAQHVLGCFLKKDVQKTLEIINQYPPQV